MARLSRALSPAIVLAAAAVLAACSKPQPAPEPIRSVKVVEVGASAFQSAHEYAGEVRPRVESRLGFRVGGKLTRRHVDLGERVKVGQVLAQLDPQDFQLAAQASQAQVAAARTQRDLAAADYQRFQVLREQNFISGAELERRESTLKAAQAQLEQAQAQLASQGNQARYTTLVADVAGVVTGIEAEPGQVVAAGTPVLRIAQEGPRDVAFAVPEDKVADIRAGSSVGVRFVAGVQAVTGQVREVGASADPATRTYAVKVGLDAGVRPPLGSTAYVAPAALSLAGTPVIKLPTSALRQEGRGSAVWVLDRTTMTVQSQPVEVATADGNEAVIASGVQPGMLVVSAGVHVLAPGQKVSIYEDKAAAGRAAGASAAPSALPVAAK